MGNAVEGRRLPAAMAALMLVVLCLSAIEWHVTRALPAQLALFASFTSPVKLTGNLLQRAAFETPDMLVVYGSSELDRPAHNRPDAFFRAKPTGYAVFPVGRGGTTCLLILQKLAAAGAAVHGKKTVVFLSPTWFAKEEVDENAVDANLTVPQLSAWIFNRELSTGLRQKIALRLREYSASLDHQPLLTLALTCLAQPDEANRLLLRALAPLGTLQNALLARVEYCAIWREMIVYGRGSRIAATDPPAALPLNWDELTADALAEERRHDSGVPYSAVNATGGERERAIRYQAPGSRDAGFITKVRASAEWRDLDLLIAGLHELGAEALFISQPFNGLYRDLGGTTFAGRSVYYQELARRVQPSGFPFREFSEHEEDRFFFNDSGHPSAAAWIFYDHAIDNFYRHIHD